MKDSKFITELEEANEEAKKVLRMTYDNFTSHRSFMASKADMDKFFEGLNYRFSLRETESHKDKAYKVARNLLLNVAMIDGTYSKHFAHPAFLDDEDCLIFYRCLGILKIENWDKK